MTKNFDKICKSILGEMITAPNQQQKPNTNQPQQPVQKPGQPSAPGAGAPAAIQNNVQNNQNPQQNNQMGDEELLKLLQQKLNDEKFKQSLMQLMNPQQQNAVNKPA